MSIAASTVPPARSLPSSLGTTISTSNVRVAALVLDAIFATFLDACQHPQYQRQPYHQSKSVTPVCGTATTTESRFMPRMVAASWPAVAAHRYRHVYPEPAVCWRNNGRSSSWERKIDRLPAQLREQCSAHLYIPGNFGPSRFSQAPYGDFRNLPLAALDQRQADNLFAPVFAV